jgi:hypothetical protein
MRGLKSILLLGAILAICGCGLPDQYYIQQPTQTNQATGLGTTLTFANPDHNKDLNITFKGYELWYQFYDINTIPPNNVYDPTNPASVDNQLLSAGLHLVVSAADTTSSRTDPVLPVSLGDIGAAFFVTVTIDTSASPPAAQYTYSGGGVIAIGNLNLRRYVPDPNNAPFFRDFPRNSVVLNNYVPGTEDCTRIGGTDNRIRIAVWAVSYGLIGVSTPQRSVPTYLGYLEEFIN